MQTFQESLTLSTQGILRLYPAVQYQGVIEIFLLRIGRPHQRNLLFRKAAQIRMEYAIQGNILQGIIQNPQEM